MQKIYLKEMDNNNNNNNDNNNNNNNNNNFTRGQWMGERTLVFHIKAFRCE